jgi:hypothetical protein
VEKEATIKGEQNDILDLYQKVEDIKDKLSFMTVVMTRTLSEEDFGEDVLHGYQLTMYSLEDEFKEIEPMLNNLLDNQRNFDSAEARIKAGCSQKFIIEDIETVKKYIEYIDKLKVRAEGVLKRGQGLLQRYQAA